MRIRSTLAPVGLLLTSAALAQPSFTDRPDLLPQATHSAVCMGVADMNGDGRDDLGVLDESKHFRVFYQNADGSFVAYDYGLMENDEEWGMALADVDQDGHKDVLSGSFQMNYLRIASPGNAQPVSILGNSNFFVQCVSIGDMDNDGWLDGFACNDNGAPGTWLNDQSGALTIADLVDFATNPGSDMSGNYGSAFTDFDLDGDIDFYIAHCRQGVSDPNDPRRWDRLFVNDGTGHFTDEATARGVQNNWQTWAADFGDWDNDGDFDLVTVNHDRDMQFMENDGTGHFTEISDNNLNLTGFLLEVHMEDFDNDGFLDVIASGGPHYFLKGNGDGTFTRVNNVFPSDKDIQGFAIGDLNNDGAMDLWASYGDGYTSPDLNHADKLWMNNGNSNHWLNVRLQGVESNRDGIGAHVTLTTALGTQVREVRSGESYGMTNTAMCHFGLGTNTTIPTLTVTWPSGQVDTYTDVDADQTLTLVEGGCNAQPIAITSSTSNFSLCGEDATSLILTASGTGTFQWSTGASTASIDVDQAGVYTVEVTSNGCRSTNTVFITSDPVLLQVSLSADNNLCPGEEVTLTAESTGPYLWSTGATTASINVDEAGVYIVGVPGNGCVSPAHVTITADVVLPIITLSADAALCPGEEVTLTSSAASSYSWSTGATTQSITTGTAGSYTVTVDNSCPDVVSDAVDVEVLPAPTTPTSTDVTIPAPGTAELTANDPTVLWYDVAEGGTPVGSGSPWTTPFLNNDATFWCAVPGPSSTETIHGGLLEIGNANTETDDGFYLLFTAAEPFTLLSVKVRANSAGDRVIALVDGTSGTVVSQDTYTLPLGESRIQLDLSITPGFYGLRVIGTPNLTWENADGFPYPLGTVGAITGVRTPQGGTSTQFWENFYDWEIEVGSQGCESLRTPVLVTVDGTTGIHEADAEGLALYPVPATGMINIAFGTISGPVDMDVLDMTGRSVKSEHLVAGAAPAQLDIAKLAVGEYSLRIRHANGISVKRIIVR